MLSVKFKAPIVIDEKNLGQLLSLAGVAAEVEPYDTMSLKPGRKPRAVAAPAADPEPEPEVSAPEPTEVKKKPGRSKKEEAKAEEASEPVDSQSLLARFSSLIDSDFDAARGLLEEFGVGKFSDLAESDFANFSNKMSEVESAGA